VGLDAAEKLRKGRGSALRGDAGVKQKARVQRSKRARSGQKA